MNSLRPGSKEFAAIVDAAARELVAVDHRVDGSIISTPLIYPSGSSVLVKVEPASRTEFFVSDFGMGFAESDMMGATHQFSRHAPHIAEAAGVGFDSHCFFVAKVSRDQLPGAAAAIANCSLEAVSIAAQKLAEKKFSEDATVLHKRLISIFTERSVSKDIEVVGASQTKWRVSNLVHLGDHFTIFEPVTQHHASIATAVTKFHDIARLELPPKRVAVVRKKAEFGTYLSVLSQAADVVSRDVPDTVFRKLAA